MARVEVSKNQGIGPIRCKNANPGGGGTADSTIWANDEYSYPILTNDYTVHGYQVQVTNGAGVVTEAAGTTNIAVYIEATNDDSGGDGVDENKTPQNWQTVAAYNIQGAGAGNANTTGILYSDIWNFKWARVRVDTSNAAGRAVIVLEKHNA